MPNAPIHPISTYCAASVRRSYFLLPLQSAAKYERERCREAEEDRSNGSHTCILYAGPDSAAEVRLNGKERDKKKLKM